jgi:cytochrome c oxidase assembly protein subunit 15
MGPAATGLGLLPRAFRALAWGALACTLGLLVIGGLVTSLEVGMSVPDATTTLGSPLVLAPQDGLTAGQRVEHAHRLAGMVVGVVALLLAATGLVGAWRGALAPRLGLGAGLALCLVCVQGFLGMARVAANSVGWAMVHAGLAQAVVALLAGLATASLARWPRLAAAPGEPTPVRAGVVACVAVYGQALLGIATRHLGPLQGGAVAEWHVLGAMVATGCVGALAMAAMSLAPLRGLALALLTLLVVQLGLGFAAWGAAYTVGAGGTMPFAVAVATGHMVVGAALLGTTVATTLVAWQSRRPAATAAGDGLAPVAHRVAVGRPTAEGVGA